MKYVWLSLSIICLVATIVFIIRKDFMSLPVSVCGTIINFINFCGEVLDNE